MATASEHVLSVGDRVSWREGGKYGPHAYGIVSRVGDRSVSATPDGGGKAKIFRKSRYGRLDCTYVTPDEYAREMWKRRKPVTPVATVHALGDGTFNVGGFGGDLARIDQGIAELTLLRAWMAERPVSP